MHEAIEKRIKQFLADADPRLSWLRAEAREYNWLPLYLGWAAVLGIRPDGSFVRLVIEEMFWEGDPEVFKTISDPYWERFALCQGAKKYPELRALIPPRPADAVDCEDCGGTGQLNIPKWPDVICKCVGVGWLIPDEVRGPSPG